MLSTNFTGETQGRTILRPPMHTYNSSQLAGEVDPPPQYCAVVDTASNRKSVGPATGHDATAAYSWGTWTMENLTLTMAVVLTGAVVGILVWMDDEPYFESWTVPLSINTVLAILAAAISAGSLHAVSSAIGQLKWLEFKTEKRTLAMWDVYDDCSRGPLGALEALYKLPGSILKLGTLFTLGSLSIGTFTQQTVELVPRNVTTPDPASTTMRFALEYNTFPRQNGLFTWKETDIATRDPGIRGAVLRGLYGDPTTPSFRCGGACSWPGTHQMVAFTSTCRNVTRATMRTKQCAEPGLQTVMETVCNMTTPGGVRLSTRFVVTNSATVLVLNTTTNDDLRAWLPDDVPDGIVLETPRAAPELLRLAVLRSTSGPDTGFNGREINNEDVTECAVSLVLREFADVRTNGTNFTPGSVTDYPLGPGTWMRTQTSAKSPSSVFSFNTTASGAPLPGGVNGTSREVVVGQQDLLNLFAYFTSPAFRSDIISGASHTPESGGAVFAFVGTLVNATTTTPGAPAAVDSVGALVGSMADAMSEYVRTSTPTSFEVGGSKVAQVVFVRVVWPWLAPPVVLQVLAVVFVGLVMWRNRRGGGRGLPLWRSSATAVLLHSYDPVKGVLREPPGCDVAGAGGRVDGGKGGMRAMLQQTVTLETEPR
ncbi:DUF3176 domain-containing protein [Microdochium nivale]|nr:DUF3176 domain-containing protein [Microdochium nivale]